MGDATAMEPATITLYDAADHLQISYSTAKKLAADGQLPGAFKVGKLWRVRKTDFEAWVGRS